MSRRREGCSKWTVARPDDASTSCSSRVRPIRSAANEAEDTFDAAQPLTQQGTDDAVIEELQRHLEAIDRAERRLEAGTYGHSVRSGLPIPDERLEDDPTAELTVEEAAEDS